MFDIGMAEMLVIGVVALIVVGPKDLPMMFRKVGNFVGRARGMARDFQRAMDSAADDVGVNDIKSSLDEATDMSNLGLDDVKPASTSFGEQYDAVSDKITGGKAEAAKPAAKKAAAKKTAAKKPATKKPAAKKPAAKKPAVKKTAAKAKPAPKAKS